MSDKPGTPPSNVESAMAANAKSRDRQGRQMDRVRRAAAEHHLTQTIILDDRTAPRIGRDTD